MACAVQLADYFSLLPQVRLAALTGSLARPNERRRARDIDLVLLHDGTLGDRMVTLLGKIEEQGPYGNVYKVPNHSLHLFLKETFGVDLMSVARFLREKVPCKVDLIMAHVRILAECDYLEQFSVMDGDPDFAKRVFVEIPLLGFDAFRGEFSQHLRHSGPRCTPACLPKRSWNEVKQSRKIDTSWLRATDLTGI